MKAAIYARVSSDTQRDRHTIDNQLRELPAFVAALGWELVDTYTDDGRSAKTGKLDRRDGFARLLADAERHKFDALVVVDVDRLTRTDSIEERARILGPLQRNGIRIVTPSGGELDMRTMFGELWVTIRALAAADENRRKAEAIRSGKLRAIAEGRKPSGPTPFGLAYDRAGGEWSIAADRAATAAEICDRIIAGESCAAIADDLHARNAPSPRGPWSRHKVWQIARSRHLVGEWIADKRRRLTVPVPAIVTESTWHRVQERLIQHGKRGLIKTRHVYLIEGLAICGACGCPIAIRSMTRGRRGGINPAAYVCRARKGVRRGDPSCSAPILRVADVDARVWEAIAGELDDPALADEIRGRRAARDADRRDWDADARGYRSHLARLDRVEAGVLARYRRGSISETVIDTELAAIGRERTAVAAQLDAAVRAAAGAAQESAGSVDDVIAELRALAAIGSPEARQRVVRAIVPERGVVFDGRRIKMRLRVDTEVRAPALVVSAGYRTHRENSQSDRGVIRITKIA